MSRQDNTITPITTLIKWIDADHNSADSKRIFQEFIQSIFDACRSNVKKGRKLDDGAVLNNLETVIAQDPEYENIRFYKSDLEQLRNYLEEILFPFMMGEPNQDILSMVHQMVMNRLQPDSSIVHRIPTYVEESSASAARKVFNFVSLLKETLEKIDDSKKESELADDSKSLAASEFSEVSEEESEIRYASKCKINIESDKHMILESLAEVFYNEAENYINNNSIRKSPRLEVDPKYNTPVSEDKSDSRSNKGLRRRLFSTTSLPDINPFKNMKLVRRKTIDLDEPPVSTKENVAVIAQKPAAERKTKRNSEPQKLSLTDIEVVSPLSVDQEERVDQKPAQDHDYNPTRRLSKNQVGALWLRDKWRALSRSKKALMVTLLVVSGVVVPFSSLIAVLVFAYNINKAEQEQALIKIEKNNQSRFTYSADDERTADSSIDDLSDVKFPVSRVA